MNLANSTYPAGAEFYYVYNGQGDVIGILDSAGTKVVTYTYDSWGKPVTTTGRLATTVGLDNSYRYKGYRYDTETGLYYLNSRYYNPEWDRFINADDVSFVTASLDDLTDKNLFAYCDNNPVNRADSSGYIWETFLDIASMVWSAYDLITKPSWANAAYLAWDVGATLIPFVPGSYIVKFTKLTSKVKVVKRAGRSGKQAHLRQIANSDKVSSALRGEIKRDINQIKRGKRTTIRVPSGYQMAHKRGYEARKGFDYGYSVLNDTNLHKLQHKYDKGGRGGQL